MLALLKLLPIGAQVGIALAVIAAVSGGYYAWSSGYFDKGVAYERAQQKERDDEAVGNARKGSSAVDDCYRDGGLWNQSRGLCDGR